MITIEVKWLELLVTRLIIFPPVAFQVVMLYVDEDTSITRQMARAEIASLHNKRILDAGTGDLR